MPGSSLESETFAPVESVRSFGVQMGRCGASAGASSNQISRLGGGAGASSNHKSRFGGAAGAGAFAEASGASENQSSFGLAGALRGCSGSQTLSSDLGGS